MEYYFLTLISQFDFLNIPQNPEIVKEKITKSHYQKNPNK